MTCRTAFSRRSSPRYVERRSPCRRGFGRRARSSRRTRESARAFRTFTFTSSRATKAMDCSRRGSSGSGRNTRTMRRWRRSRRRSGPRTTSPRNGPGARSPGPSGTTGLLAVELDVSSVERHVALFVAGQRESEVVDAATRLAAVSDHDVIGTSARRTTPVLQTVDPASRWPEVRVSGDCGALRARSGRAVIDVLKEAPEGALLDSTRDGEVGPRPGLGRDEAAAGHEVLVQAVARAGLRGAGDVRMS